MDTWEVSFKVSGIPDTDYDEIVEAIEKKIKTIGLTVNVDIGTKEEG